MRDEEFRDALRSARAGDPVAQEILSRMSPSLHDLDAVEEARDALRAIREDAEAEVEGREVAIRIRRWNLWTAAACGSVLVVPLPSLGWRGVVEAGLCLMLGFVVGETLNQRVRDQEAAAGRVGPRA